MTWDGRKPCGDKLRDFARIPSQPQDPPEKGHEGVGCVDPLQILYGYGYAGPRSGGLEVGGEKDAIGSNGNPNEVVNEKRLEYIGALGIEKAIVDQRHTRTKDHEYDGSEA